MMNDIDKIRDQLRAKITHQNERLGQLDKSLALEDFIPDAFRAGKCRVRVCGNDNEGYTWTLTRGDGSTEEYNILDVPENVITPEHKEPWNRAKIPNRFITRR